MDLETLNTYESLMNNPFGNSITADIASIYATFFGLIVAIAIWSIIWKGIGLWRAARMGNKQWFIAILTFSTAGILPIFYILFTRNEYKKLQQKQSAVTSEIPKTL